MKTGRSRRTLAALIGAVATAAVILLLPGLVGAESPATPIKGLKRCALGDVPRYLSKELTSEISSEQQQFMDSLRGVGKTGRKQAGRDFAIGVAAYIYGMPTVLLRDTVGKYPPNQLIGLGRLATPDSQAVVAPNHDTLYAVARADLADGPVVIDAPATGGRYSVLQIMDASTNSTAYVGSRHDRDTAGVTLLTPPGWDGDVPPGARVVESPTNIAWVLGRTLVDDAETERVEAQDLMKEYALTPLTGWLLGMRRHEVVVDKAPDSPKQPIADRADALRQARHRVGRRSADRRGLRTRAVRKGRYRRRSDALDDVDWPPGRRPAGSPRSRRARRQRGQRLPLRLVAGAQRRLAGVAGRHRPLRPRLHPSSPGCHRGPRRQHARGGLLSEDEP